MGAAVFYDRKRFVNLKAGKGLSFQREVKEIRCNNNEIDFPIMVETFDNWELRNDCANIIGELTDAELSKLAAVENLRVIQPWKYLPKQDTWLKLNSKVFKTRPEVKLHIWADFTTETFDFLSKLDNVRDLEINQVRFKDKNSLGTLIRLKHLRIVNGNLNDLSFLENFYQLETLELALTKNFTDLSFVSRVKSLKTLTLNGFRNITNLPNVKDNINLHELVLINLKSLSDLSPIKDATNLRVLVCQRLSPTIEPSDCEFIKNLKYLSEVRIDFGNKNKNQELLKLTSNLNLWNTFDNGSTIGTKGSESGVIIIDVEYSLGARITIEKNTDVAPRAITLGIYGNLMHTFYCDDMPFTADKNYRWFKRKIEDFFRIEQDDNKSINQLFEEIIGH